MGRMKMKCPECETNKKLIREIFDATGYMDLYNNDTVLMARAIKQGIARDQKVLTMYCEAGKESVKSLDIILRLLKYSMALEENARKEAGAGCSYKKEGV
jgi:hypothetical protein